MQLKLRVSKSWLKLACIAALAALPASGLLAATRAAFDKAVKEVQEHPYDTSLRKKVFKLARELKNLPEIPDEVAILKGKASYVVKNASSPSDYGPAVDAYKKATNLAPWVPGLYYNLGVVQEKAGRAEEATESFKLYLAADPDAEDRDKVLARLGGLEVQKEEQEQRGAALSSGVSSLQGRSADPVALKKWESRQSGQIAVGVVSGVSVGMGALFVGMGLGQMDSAKAYSTAGTRSGVLYNKYYEGKYYSSASYSDYTGGQTMVGMGWVFMGVGALGILIAVAMDPGPKPVALLEMDGDQLALGLPQVELNERLDGLNVGLLQAKF
jgi:tetratricopeptide (TPR) repeat protein